MGESSISVLPDAQFSLARIVKPYPGFEAVYQGRTAPNPVAFPGERDADAGKPGFDANLMAAIEVPFGARVVLWIPLCVSTTGGVPSVTLYTYSVYWRMRNVTDFRNRRRPYHLQNQSPGVADTTPVTGGPRFVIPAAAQLLAFEETEPVGATDPGVLNLRAQTFIPRAGGIIEPVFADGQVGRMQQGIYDPFVDGGLANDPIFNPFWFDAEGDEMIILAQRTDQAAGAWNFATTDLAFSNIYGTGNGTHPNLPDLGIYVFTGVNP